MHLFALEGMTCLVQSGYKNNIAADRVEWKMILFSEHSFNGLYVQLQFQSVMGFLMRIAMELPMGGGMGVSCVVSLF